MDGPGLTATLKAGTGYDAPWIVLHANNPEQLNAQLDAIDDALMQKVTATAQLLIAANNLAAKGMLSAPAPSQPSVQTPPYQAPTPPAAQATPTPAEPSVAAGPVCVHGPRVRREGTSGRGPWVGWFCPTKKGTPGQCSPEFE
jgi:hypothetical protein